MKKFIFLLSSFLAVLVMIFVFSCSKSSPEEPSGAITKTPTPTFTLTQSISIPTLTPTFTATLMNSLYSFTTDQTGDWTVESVFSNKVYNTTNGNNRPGCLQVTGDFSTTGAKGTIKRYLGVATDFTGSKITCWIYVPAELVNATKPYGVQIFVQDASWGWDAKWINITAAGWQKYEWILPSSLNQDITKIIQVGIQISAGTGSPVVTNPVTILFDDIHWEVGITPTSTPTPGGVLYSFDTDQTGDWDVEPVFSNKVYNTNNGNTAIGCLQVTGDFSTTGVNGTIKRYLGSGTDFTGKTITCWINIPADLVNATNPYGVQIFVQDNNWGWDAQWINITAEGWQKFEWVLPSSLSNNDITKIVQVGIQITAGDGSPTVPNTVTILFDDINW